MSSRTLIAICTAALLAPVLNAQDHFSVRDPIRDYLNDFETRPGEQLIVSQTDLNGDGTDEVFLSRTSLYNGRQGNIWVVYESLPDGSWKRHESLSGEEGGVIEFHPNAVSVQPDGKGGKKLVRYSPGSSRSGRITTFQLRNGGVSESVQEGEILPGDKHEGLYAKTFENPQTKLAFQWQNMDELRDRYLPFNGWFHEITAGKLVFLTLCVFAPLWVLRGILGIFFRRKRDPA